MPRLPKSPQPRSIDMHNAQITKVLIPVLALSLSACSSTSSGPVKSDAHTALIGPPASNGPSFKGSGKWTATTRNVEQFHAIELRDPIKLQVDIGRPLSVSVEADDNIAEAIETRVEAGKLVVSINKSFQAYRAPEVVVAVPELSEISNSSSGDIKVSGVRGDIFKVDNSGSGNFFATGKVTTEKINSSGSGKVDCVTVSANNVTVDLSGAGDCTLDAEKSLAAQLRGAGNIKYKGNPASLNKSDTGAGTISNLTR